MGEEKERLSGVGSRPSPGLPTVNPNVENLQSQQDLKSNGIHPAVYVTVWISLSSSVILFNKWILSTLQFHYPILLTAWHLVFATIMTQILARTTRLLDGRKTLKMTGKVYLRAIVPIGLFFQPVTNLRKLNLSLLKCLFYPNAQSVYSSCRSDSRLGPRN